MKGRKKLGDLVEPIFKRMGAKIKKGHGLLVAEVTRKQLDDFFRTDPLGVAIMKMKESGELRNISLTEEARLLRDRKSSF